MAWYLVFWRNQSTATVVPAASAGQARSRAKRNQKKGYGAIVAARRANPQDADLIRNGTWVRRRRDGTCPQFATSPFRAGARRKHSRYRSWTELQPLASGQPHRQPPHLHSKK
jgi:hypothetical protein